MGLVNQNFMLKNEPAKRIYELIKDQPIFDYHCHLNPQEIYEDKPYDNIVDLWLGGDHYKWRLMRANGIAEEEITGQASKLDKFKAFARTLEKAYGNPVYHWSAMELANVFGVEESLGEDNAEEIYDRLNAYLRDHKVGPRSLIKASKVAFIGTTDNPLDNLVWHQRLAQDPSFDTIVAPTFRPDQAFVSHPDFVSFVQKLEEVTQRNIRDFATFVRALGDRVTYFAQHGCLASDISFGEIVFQPVIQEADLDMIFDQAMAGQALSVQQIRQWQTQVFVELCRLYKEAGFVTQVHFGAMRNNHTGLYQNLGPDIGVDSIGDQIDLSSHLNALLDHLVQVEALPKMVWYNLNPAYNILVANTLQNFQSNQEGVAGYLQFGAGWWFADTKLGMVSQMNALAEQGLLANFIGMLTDSRSFLSYQRHDYFRRILASYLGQWIEEGEVPADYEKLGAMAQAISYGNAKKYFEREAE